MQRYSRVKMIRIHLPVSGAQPAASTATGPHVPTVRVHTGTHDSDPAVAQEVFGDGHPSMSPLAETELPPVHVHNCIHDPDESVTRWTQNELLCLAAAQYDAIDNRAGTPENVASAFVSADWEVVEAHVSQLLTDRGTTRELKNLNSIQRLPIHPVSRILLLAMAVKASGHRGKGLLAWSDLPDVLWWITPWTNDPEPGIALGAMLRACPPDLLPELESIARAVGASTRGWEAMERMAATLRTAASANPDAAAAFKKGLVEGARGHLAPDARKPLDRLSIQESFDCLLAARISQTERVIREEIASGNRTFNQREYLKWAAQHGKGELAMRVLEWANHRTLDEHIQQNFWLKRPKATPLLTLMSGSPDAIRAAEMLEVLLDVCETADQARDMLDATRISVISVFQQLSSARGMEQRLIHRSGLLHQMETLRGQLRKLQVPGIDFGRLQALIGKSWANPDRAKPRSDS